MHRFRAAAGLGLAAALLGFQVFGPRPQRGFLVDAVFDAGHAVLFGVLAVVLLELLGLWAGRSAARGEIRTPSARYFQAFALTGLAGAVTEALQFRGPRDADPVDWARDLLGGAGCLLLYAAAAWGFRSRTRRGLTAILGLGILVAGTWPLWNAASVVAGRRAGAPAIADFDRHWGRSLILVRDAEVSWPRRPAAGEPGDRVARVTYLPARYPAFIIRQPMADWSSYEAIRFTVFSELDREQRIILRIADRPTTEDYRDQFQLEIRVQPGENPVRIPLESVGTALNGRHLDLTRIRSIVLFEVEPPEPFTLSFGTFRLE